MARSRYALNAVDTRLVRREHALIQLLDPPLDHSGLDPGYIRAAAVLRFATDVLTRCSAPALFQCAGATR